MKTAEESPIFFVAFLAVVGHVDHDGILLGKKLHDSCHDAVVVEYCVVVVGQDGSLLVVELRPEGCIAVLGKLPAVGRVTVTIGDMLPKEVDDGEIVFGILTFQRGIIVEQSFVEGMER